MRLIAKCPIHRTKMSERAAGIKTKIRTHTYFCTEFPNCEYYIRIIEPSFLLSFFKTKRIRARNQPYFYDYDSTIKRRVVHVKRGKYFISLVTGHKHLFKKAKRKR